MNERLLGFDVDVTDVEREGAALSCCGVSVCDRAGDPGLLLVISSMADFVGLSIGFSLTDPGLLQGPSIGLSSGFTLRPASEGATEVSGV